MPGEQERALDNSPTRRTKKTAAYSYKIIGQLFAPLKNKILPLEGYDDINLDKNLLAAETEKLRISCIENNLAWDIAKIPGYRYALYYCRNEQGEELSLILTSVLGKGSLGTVYKGYDWNSRQWLSIKTPNEENEDDNDTIIKNELLLKTGLSEQRHFDISPAETPIMKLGEISFKDYLNAQVQLSSNPLRLHQLHQLLCIALNISSAVHTIHQAGYVHHDLKPANILVNPHTCKTRIIDLDDCPKIGQEPETYTKAYSEYKNFAEFFKAKVAKPSYDVYSLGLIFKEMFRQRRYTKTTTDGKKCNVLHKITYANSCEKIIQRIDAAINMMLEKDHAKRPNPQLISTYLSDLANDCYIHLLNERTELQKTGIIDFDKAILVSDTLEVSIDKAYLPAMQALDGCYLYLWPDENGKQKFYKEKHNFSTVVDKLLEQCRQHKRYNKR